MDNAKRQIRRLQPMRYRIDLRWVFGRWRRRFKAFGQRRLNWSRRFRFHSEGKWRMPFKHRVKLVSPAAMWMGAQGATFGEKAGKPLLHNDFLIWPSCFANTENVRKRRSPAFA